MSYLSPGAFVIGSKNTVEFLRLIMTLICDASVFVFRNHKPISKFQVPTIKTNSDITHLVEISTTLRTSTSTRRFPLQILSLSYFIYCPGNNFTDKSALPRKHLIFPNMISNQIVAWFYKNAIDFDVLRFSASLCL